MTPRTPGNLLFALLLAAGLGSCHSKNDSPQAAQNETAVSAPVLVTVQPVQPVAQNQPVM